MARRSAASRDRSRGVAVLEFTLSLVFIVPLLMAALNFGYYFYIASNAEEAARQGLRQAVAMATPCAAGPPPVCAVAVNAAVTQNAAGTGTACVGGAAACYMNSPELGMGAASTTTVTCECAIGPVNPTYTIKVFFDFAPSVGYFKFLMPGGGPTGTVRYTATLVGN